MTRKLLAQARPCERDAVRPVCARRGRVRLWPRQHRDLTRRQHRIRPGCGGAKLCHSGNPFRSRGGCGDSYRGAVSQGPSGVPGRNKRARGRAPLRGLTPEREEDASVFGAAGLPTHSAGAPTEARRVYRADRAVARGRSPPRLSHDQALRARRHSGGGRSYIFLGLGSKNPGRPLRAPRSRSHKWVPS